MKRPAIVSALAVIILELSTASVSAVDDYFLESIPVYQLDVQDDQDPDTFSYMVDWVLTASPGEMSVAVANGWDNRGIAFYVSPAQIPGTVLLHRLYNPAGTDHFCTTSWDEVQAVIPQGYVYEGAIGYVFPANAPAAGTVPLQRFYSGGDAALHMYYTNAAAGGGANYEGVACHVWPARQRIASMAITAPTAGEEVKGAGRYDVSWNSSAQGGFIALSYSTDAGNTWTPVEAGIQNTGLTHWKVPNVDCQHARLKIVWTDFWWGATNVLAAVASPFDFRIKKFTVQPGMMQARVKKLRSPTALIAKVVSPLAIQVSWRAVAGDSQGYIVERRVGNGRFMQVANVKATELNFTDKFVSPGTAYVYRVRSYGQDVSSGYSRTASVMTAHSLKKPPLRASGKSKDLRIKPRRD